MSDGGFDAWMAEVCRLDPGNLDENTYAPPGYFKDVWRAIYEGGFTPQEATADARISAWLQKLDDEADKADATRPKLGVVRDT